MNRATPVLALIAVAAASNAQFFTDEAAFLAALDSPFYLEQFDGWDFGTPLDGSSEQFVAPGANGFGWTAEAVGGLFSVPGAISTNSAIAPIEFAFTGAPVTAFGLYISVTDFDANQIAGNVKLQVSTGSELELPVGTGESKFIGWMGTEELAWARIFSDSGAATHWVAGDDVYTGQPVPEPATIAALGVGAFALLRRRKRD